MFYQISLTNRFDKGIVEPTNILVKDFFQVLHQKMMLNNYSVKVLLAENNLRKVVAEVGRIMAVVFKLSAK